MEKKQENLKNKKLLLEIPPKIHKDIKVYCAKKEISIKQFFCEQVKKVVNTNM